MKELNVTDNLFSGEDRLEIFSILGRPIRKGSFEALKVSDFERVKEALNKKDAALALSYVESLHPLYTAMIATFLEWGLALPDTLAKLGYATEEKEITKQSAVEWLEGVADKNHEAVIVMKDIYNSLNTSTIHAFRENQQAGKPNEAAVMLGKPFQTFATVVELIKQNNFEKALSEFTAYSDQMRERHDLSGEYISSYISIVQQKIKQEIASETMQKALESTPYLEGMWMLAPMLKPDELTSVLAEHMRGHFSGVDRKGGIEIIEEKDKYRLVFGPCGTGGVFRQRNVKGLKKFPKATPETWNRENQVPSYCSHCAKNELTSISKVGYPLWVTEFNPDENKPCGWTVYKDPSLIPDEYFTRLGITKDPSKFK
jgi:hypothetical protein